MSISRLQNDQENERRWAEEQGLAKLRAENERLRRTLTICANNVQAVVEGVLRHGDALSRIANVIAEAGQSEGEG